MLSSIFLLLQPYYTVSDTDYRLRASLHEDMEGKENDKSFDTYA